VTSLRLSLGLFTIMPVGYVGDVDRQRARNAMLWAPIIGILIGSIAAAALWGVHALVPTSLGAVLAAVASIGLVAYLTRALHLDGLADTADALGSGKPADVALSIARRGDVGPFGVVTILVTLLIQIAALAVLTEAGAGAIALVMAVATGRLAATLACTSGIPAARPEGLGALVAGTVPRWASTAWTLAAIAAATGVGLVLIPGAPWMLPVAIVVGLVVALLLVRRSVRRLGGVTGDVMGAAVEIATTAALLVAALAYASSLTW
jgi:adenosylcobinamide-GDP ribazoletransferase